METLNNLSIESIDKNASLNECAVKFSRLMVVDEKMERIRGSFAENVHNHAVRCFNKHESDPRRSLTDFEMQIESAVSASNATAEVEGRAIIKMTGNNAFANAYKHVTNALREGGDLTHSFSVKTIQVKNIDNADVTFELSSPEEFGALTTTSKCRSFVSKINKLREECEKLQRRRDVGLPDVIEGPIGLDGEGKKSVHKDDRIGLLIEQLEADCRNLLEEFGEGQMDQIESMLEAVAGKVARRAASLAAQRQPASEAEAS